MKRRKFILSALVGAGGAIASLMIAVPALLAVLSPALAGRPANRWRAVGPVDDFPIDRLVKAIVQVQRGDWAQSLNAKAVYVWRRSDDEFVVYSRNCTDLSCPILFDEGSECFFCPCHGGIFGKDGQPMAGPPKFPLYRYANRVRDGVLEIDLSSVPSFA